MKRRLEFREIIGLAGLILFVVSIVLTAAPNLATAKEKRIRVLTREQQGRSIEVFNEIAKRFEEKNSGVKVDIERCDYGDFETKMIAAIQANRAYEAIQGPAESLVANFGARGLILPLKDVVDALGRDDYIEGLLADFWGHNYQIPYWAFGCGLWYRSDIFQEKGLKPPETWDDMLNVAKALTEGDQYGFPLIYGPSDWTQEQFFMWYWANGGRIFDMNCNIAFDQEPYRSRMKQTLEFYQKMKPYSPPGSVDYDWNTSQIAFAEGKTAMNVYWVRQLSNVVEHNPKIEPYTKQVHLPLGPNGKVKGAGGGAHGWVVMSQARYPELGKEFIKHFMTGENYIDWLLAVPGMYKPSRKSYRENQRWLSDPLIQKHKDDIMVSIEAARGGPWQIAQEWRIEDPKHWNIFAQSIQYSKTLNNMVHKVTAKGYDIGKAIAEAAEETREELMDVKKNILREVGKEKLIEILGKSKFEAAYKGI